MGLIFITGNSGAGKSSVRNELRRRGYEAHDTDENDITSWRHKITDEVVERPDNESKRTKEWYAEHDWVMSRNKVEELADQAKHKTIFLCGSPSNADDMLDLFGEVIFLVVDEDTLRFRLETRTDNDYGKAPDELNNILGWHKSFEDRYRESGAIMIDATQPIEKVAEQIIAVSQQFKKELAFVDPANTTAVAKKLYPDAKHVRVIEHGYDNIVALVDDTCALRFPRNSEALIRDNYEKLIMQRINLGDIRINMPFVLEELSNPVCFVTEFVKGEHLSTDEINSFSTEEQQQFAHQIAKFAHVMHSSISVDEVKRVRRELHLDKLEEGPWEEYLERYLLRGTLPTQEQDTIAKEYYMRWKSLPATNLVVIHDDLHSDNLLFEGHTLSGVLDFGDTSVGTAEQELRQLYRINESILRTALATYSNLAGRTLNIEAAKLWAIMQELGAYASRISNGKATHPAVGRAAKYLNTWFQTDIW